MTFVPELKDLLVNLLIIILPIYIYFVFCNGNGKFIKNKVISSIVGSIMVILCMIFPVSSTNGNIFDLRQIPIILVFLYLNKTAGFISLITFIVTRYLYGGVGFYGATLLNVGLVIFLLFFRKRYKEYPIRYKLIFMVALSFANVILTNLILGVVIDLDYKVIYVTSIVFIIKSIGLIIMVFSIEKIKNDFIIQRKLQKAEKAHVVSELAASVSHEVRNPLTVTKGFIQLVLTHDLPGKTKDYLNMAHNELIHAENVISDYLTFAKPALENPTKINVWTELQRTVRIITPFANMHSIQISLKKPIHTEMWIIGEPQKFHQCLSNLIKNSIEASKVGDVITLDVAIVSQMIRITIIDYGKGMTNEELLRLGEPYFSTKIKGTGLGMMVVFGIVKSMKGKINVKSEKGKGTQITIDLPQIS